MPHDGTARQEGRLAHEDRPPTMNVAQPPRLCSVWTQAGAPVPHMGTYGNSPWRCVTMPRKASPRCRPKSGMATILRTTSTGVVFSAPRRHTPGIKKSVLPPRSGFSRAPLPRRLDRLSGEPGQRGHSRGVLAYGRNFSGFFSFAGRYFSITWFNPCLAKACCSTRTPIRSICSMAWRHGL